LPEILIITKEVQFDGKGRVVAGQCLPDTDSWQLVRYTIETGTSELLFKGYYDHVEAVRQCMISGESDTTKMLIEKFTIEADARRKRKSWIFRRFSKGKDQPGS
jgi:hypothetical protein